jgi:hypothetical protein
MPRKKKKQPSQSASMRWKFDPDIPIHDFFESGSLDDMWNLQEALDSLARSKSVTGKDDWLPCPPAAAQIPGIRRAAGSDLNLPMGSPRRSDPPRAYLRRFQDRPGAQARKCHLSGGPHFSMPGDKR